MAIDLGVLISGRGSNMVALAGACARPDFPARIAIVVCNRLHAEGLCAAHELGLRTCIVDHAQFSSRSAFEQQLIRNLDEAGVELVCLAGFMRLLSVEFVERFAGRMLNIHPSLLPAFPGLHAQRQALQSGVRFSGCTVHFVTAQMDAGPIVLQAVVPVHHGDTEARLSARILEQEHRIYPQAVRLFAEGRLVIDGRQVSILGRHHPQPQECR